MRANNCLRFGLIFLCAAALAACASQRQLVAAKEDNLAAAGFLVRPANTPERQKMLARLPPDKFVLREHGDQVDYVYADPVVCDCLYVGTQQAYGQFKRHEQEQHLADERLWTAQLYSDPTWNWGAWGPWGPAFPFGYAPYGW